MVRGFVAAALGFGLIASSAAQAPAPPDAAKPATAAATAKTPAKSFLEQTTSMSIGRAFHSMAVLKNFVYVFGGSEYDPASKGTKETNSVAFAQIYTNGQLSPWLYTTSLPEPRHYANNSTLVLNDTVYILGGSTAPSEGDRLNTVIWSRPNENGTLSKWQSSAPFGQAGYSCMAAFSTPGYLWITGGLPKSGSTSQDVYSVAVLADGSLGRWERSLPLPIPLWFHHAGVVGGRVYIWGGLIVANDSKSVNDKIFSAPILNTGRLGPWTTERIVLPQGFYAASSANAGPYLFSFSPRYGGGVSSNDIWWTTVTQQGMQPWKKQATNVPMKLYHAVAPDYLRGSIYFVGGKDTGKGGEILLPLPWAVFFKLTPEARKQAEDNWMALQAAHQRIAASASTLELTTAGANVAAATPTPAMATMALPESVTTYEVARATVAGKKPVVIYYRLAGSKPCNEQDAIFTTPDFVAVSKKTAFASTDVRTNPQLAQQFGVFRSPTWIFYDSRGQERARHVGVITVAEMQEKIATLK